MEIASVAEARICVSDPIRTEKRQQALTALIESHRARLLSIIRNRIRDQVEAEDVLQDVFAEFVEAYDLGQAIEALGAWLVRVAQNKILDRFRRRKTQSEYEASVRATANPEQPSVSRPDDEWMRAWLRAEIFNALEMLPKEQRDVFVMHELEGKTFAEMATETGVSLNTLMSRKRYAVRFLRNQLKEIYDELE
jgi:RNA polymerase sigma factor (sigma-70 family)